MRAGQLLAYARLLETVVKEDDETTVAAVALALLSRFDWGSPHFILMQWDGVAAALAVDEAQRIRDGVDPTRCSVRSGTGIVSYQAGNNAVSVVAVDTQGVAGGRRVCESGGRQRGLCVCGRSRCGGGGVPCA
ncbi:MAG: hypothetical protein P4L40_03660 [Terracidiphilus sp.]|nr:hypothetical protein [Terracidiphilus sp.]